MPHFRARVVAEVFLTAVSSSSRRCGLAPSPAATHTAVRSPALHPGLRQHAEQFRIAIKVKREAFPKDVWRQEVAVVGNATDDHHRLGNFALMTRGT